MISKKEEAAVRKGFQIVAVCDDQYDAVTEQLERIEASIAELKGTLDKLLQAANACNGN